MVDVMPTGNSAVWMLRVRDKGKLYKIDLLQLIKKAGIKTDAYGQPLPGLISQPKPVIEEEKEGLVVMGTKKEEFINEKKKELVV